jgi:hypothetical protein
LASEQEGAPVPSFSGFGTTLTVYGTSSKAKYSIWNHFWLHIVDAQVVVATGHGQVLALAWLTAACGQHGS